MRRKPLIVLFAILPLLACAKENESQTPAASSEERAMTYPSEASLGENAIRVNGFESNRDLDTLMPLNYLGKVELDSEKKHTGDHSAKVTLLNQHLEQTTIGAPALYQALYNESRKIYETDVTGTKYIRLWVYNAQEEDYRIGMRPIIRSTYNWPGGPVLPTKWALTTAGAWTEISYEVNLNLIPEVKGHSHLMVGMQFVFSRPIEEEADRVFYLDDFYVVKNGEVAA